MKHAYSVLHQKGYAHSLEVRLEGSLIGGIYGISLGKHFYGESMFSLMTNGSKVALMALCQLLAQWQFAIVDCQIPTAHLISQGAVLIERVKFLKLVEKNRKVATNRGLWEIPPFRVLPSTQDI